MTDQLYLSYWVRGFTEHNMLRYFQKLLQTFPFSTMSPRAAVLRIYALEFAEPPLLERTFDWTADVGTVVGAAKEFGSPDCGFLLEGFWDLWKFDGSWRLAPSSVTMGCFGPLFQSDQGEHLRIECGLDSDFLPDAKAPESAGKTQSNIRSLLRLARELDSSLPVEHRRLWSESGENLVEKLQAALR